MPLYEFQCVECNSSFEELVRASQLPSGTAAVAGVACPTCGSRTVRRKISMFASKSSGGSSFSASAAACAPSGA